MCQIAARQNAAATGKAVAMYSWFSRQKPRKHAAFDSMPGFVLGQITQPTWGISHTFKV